MKNTLHRSKNGMTLIEVMVALLISAVGMMVISSGWQAARNITDRANLFDIESDIEFRVRAAVSCERTMPQSSSACRNALWGVELKKSDGSALFPYSSGTHRYRGQDVQARCNGVTGLDVQYRKTGSPSTTPYKRLFQGIGVPCRQPRLVLPDDPFGYVKNAMNYFSNFWIPGSDLPSWAPGWVDPGPTGGSVLFYSPLTAKAACIRLGYTSAAYVDNWSVMYGRTGWQSATSGERVTFYNPGTNEPQSMLANGANMNQWISDLDCMR